jgi:hypothetical protein
MQPGHFVPSDKMPDPSHSFWVDPPPDGVSGVGSGLGVTPPQVQGLIEHHKKLYQAYR